MPVMGTQEAILARRAALTDRSGVVAGAGLVHDEHNLLVELQMKVTSLTCMSSQSIPPYWPNVFIRVSSINCHTVKPPTGT